MLDLNTLCYNDQGLIPAVVQEAGSGRVLMMAWMNRESLELSIAEGRTCFYSRSRKELWRKGETSGHIQRIRSITADCDRDTLLITVDQTGPACHTGSRSCFFQPVFDKESTFTAEGLYELLEDRRANPKEGSYTNYLFEKGDDKILKKLGEEATEVIIGAKNDDEAELVYELADLYYHALVLMVHKGISLDKVRDELASRHVVDKKVKQETMGHES